MIQFTLRRILASIPVLFGILLVTFILARLIPGDPCKAILGEKATVQVCEKFVADHGLDKPAIVQFAVYMGKILQGDFGDSIRYSRPISIILVERLPMTIELSIAALLIAVAVGITAGVVSAIRHNSVVENCRLPAGFHVPSTTSIHADADLAKVPRVDPDVTTFSESVRLLVQESPLFAPFLKRRSL